METIITDDLMADLIENPVMINVTNISVSNSVTSMPATPSFYFDTGQITAARSRLYSFILYWDASFAAKYSYMVEVDGVQIFTNSNNASASGNAAQLPDPVATSLDLNPHNAIWHLPAGAKIRVFAYNSGSDSAARTFSVYMLLGLETNPATPPVTATGGVTGVYPK